MTPALLAEDPQLVMASLVVVIREFEGQAEKFTDMLQRSHHPNRARWLNAEAHAYRSAAATGQRFLTYLSQQHVKGAAS